MVTYHQGNFEPKNPQKMIGKSSPTWRSSWELAFMNLLDNHPNVLQWASEPLEIPYRNPLTGKQTIYIPDFLIIYIDKAGGRHGEIVEIKPLKETSMEHAKTTRDKAAVAVNTAKWKAAIQFCLHQGLTFRILTEESLFSQQMKTAPKRSVRKRRK